MTNYLLQELESLDKQIEESERALVYLNKQNGKVISKLRRLKEKRENLSREYKSVTFEVREQE